MGLLAGYTEQRNVTGDLYGKFSFGNMRESILSRDYVTDRMIPIVANDLKIAGLADKIRELDVLDVGTGRQALAFALLGAKSVSHYDISTEHVCGLKDALSREYLSLPIETRGLDLCAKAPPNPCIRFRLSEWYRSPFLEHRERAQELCGQRSHGWPHLDLSNFLLAVTPST